MRILKINRLRKIKTIMYFSKEPGYTLLELIVAIQLSMIVISLVYVSYLLSEKLYTKWQDKIQTEELLSTLSMEFSKKLNQITALNYVSPDSISADSQNGLFSLGLVNGIKLNGKTINLNNFLLKSGKIDYYGNSSNQPISLPLRRPMFADHIKAIGIHLELSRKEKRYSLEIFSRIIKRKNGIRKRSLSSRATGEIPVIFKY